LHGRGRPVPTFPCWSRRVLQVSQAEWQVERQPLSCWA
jgi:hypothetical protein